MNALRSQALRGKGARGLGGQAQRHECTRYCLPGAGPFLEGGAPGSVRIHTIVNSRAHAHAPSPAAPGSAVRSLTRVHPSTVFPHMQPLCLSTHTHSVLGLHLLLVLVPGPLVSGSDGAEMPPLSVVRFILGLPCTFIPGAPPLDLLKKSKKKVERLPNFFNVCFAYIKRLINFRDRFILLSTKF